MIKNEDYFENYIKLWYYVHECPRHDWTIQEIYAVLGGPDFDIDVYDEITIVDKVPLSNLRVSKNTVLEALNRNSWQHQRAAKELDVTPRVMSYLKKKYNIYKSTED